MKKSIFVPVIIFALAGIMLTLGIVQLSMYISPQIEMINTAVKDAEANPMVDEEQMKDLQQQISDFVSQTMVPQILQYVIVFLGFVFVLAVAGMRSVQKTVCTCTCCAPAAGQDQDSSDDAADQEDELFDDFDEDKAEAEDDEQDQADNGEEDWDESNESDAVQVPDLPEVPDLPAVGEEQTEEQEEAKPKDGQAQSEEK